MLFYTGLHIYATPDVALKVPAEYQHKVLFWGILGALLMRLVFIFAGVALLENFHWMIYAFGLKRDGNTQNGAVIRYYG
ncbi:MAG: hypothetical protein WD266_11710 [Balneolales bacterium]